MTRISSVDVSQVFLWSVSATIGDKPVGLLGRLCVYSLFPKNRWCRIHPSHTLSMPCAILHIPPWDWVSGLVTAKWGVWTFLCSLGCCVHGSVSETSTDEVFLYLSWFLNPTASLSVLFYVSCSPDFQGIVLAVINLKQG